MGYIKYHKVVLLSEHDIMVCSHEWMLYLLGSIHPTPCSNLIRAKVSFVLRHLSVVLQASHIVTR
jgi:hypothetical protein